jgi:hypothetical protein
MMGFDDKRRRRDVRANRFRISNAPRHFFSGHKPVEGLNGVQNECVTRQIMHRPRCLMEQQLEAHKREKNVHEVNPEKIT